MVYEAKLHNPSHSTFEALAVQHAVGTVMESWTLPLTKTGCRHLQHVINLLMQNTWSVTGFVLCVTGLKQEHISSLQLSTT